MIRRTAAVAAAVLLASCASSQTQDPRVANLAARIETARTDPNVNRYAPNEMQAAQQSLAKAQQDASNGNGLWVNHDVYIGQRHVDTAMALANSQAGAQASRRTASLALADVPFDTGQATLKPQARDRLQSVASDLRQHPQSTITIQGHTDEVGSAGYNQRLSQERAQSVKNYLVAQGVAPQRITTQGLGESYPVASNATPTGRAENRRAEVLVSQLPE